MADAITVLTDDHRVVAGLFTQFAGAVGAERKQQIARRIVRELSVHAEIEEQHLYPTVAAHVRGTTMTVEHSLHEHRALKEQLAELSSTPPQDPRFEELVHEIDGSVTSHVEQEERELFPRLREGLTPQELDELGARLERARPSVPTRPHPSAPNTPPGNRLLSRPTAMVDRARDALES